MRTFIEGISSYCKNYYPNFAVIPQNGANVGFPNLDSSDTLDYNFVNAIDGQAQEELYYGYDGNDDSVTPASQTTELNGYLSKLKA